MDFDLDLDLEDENDAVKVKVNDEDFLSLLDDLDAAAFVCATQTPLTLAELCHQTIIDQCAAVFSAIMRGEQQRASREEEEEEQDAGLLLPAELADEVAATMSARRLWTNELFEFALRRVGMSVVELSGQPRLTRAGPLLNSPRYLSNLRRLNVASVTLGSSLLELRARPLLEEVVLKSTDLHAVTLADCPNLHLVELATTDLQSLRVERCPSVETFSLQTNHFVDAAVAQVVEGCPNLRDLHYTARPVRSAKEIDGQEVPVVLRLADREAQLERLEIFHSGIRSIELTGGCPHLSKLTLQRCRLLRSVHITEARSLTHLRLDNINNRRDWPGPAGTTDEAAGADQEEVEEAFVRIEDASRLAVVEFRNVNAHYLDTLKSISRDLQSIKLIHLVHGAVEPRAHDIARLLLERDATCGLSALRLLHLELTREIDDFVLLASGNTSVLPALWRLVLIGKPIRNVAVGGMPELSSVELGDWHDGSPTGDASRDIIDGRVSVAGPMVRTVQLCSLRVRDLHIDCPATRHLLCWSTHVPPHELQRWPTALPALHVAEHSGLADEDAERALGHAQYRPRHYDGQPRRPDSASG